jgi:hypothetical protein
MELQTLDDVLAALRTLIDESIRTGSRLGYFAALYYKMTDRVRQGIAAGEFDDGKRMEMLDVRFASRYLDALYRWKANKNDPAITASWKLVFEASEKSSVLLLQHLLAGINAHINLDLGIATADVAGGPQMVSIHNDFNTINGIIGSLTYQVVTEISRISPLLSLLGLHATNETTVLVQFSIANARDGAWAFAEELSAQPSGSAAGFISDRDKTIAQLGTDLIRVKGLAGFTCRLIHLFEWKKPSRIIRALQEYQKKNYAYSHAGIAAAAPGTKVMSGVGG